MFRHSEQHKTRVTIQSLERGISILELLAKASDGLSVSSLSQTLELNKSTVCHLLSTLLASGYAEQDPWTKRYFIGNQVANLYEGYVSRGDNWNEMTSYLDLLVQQTGEAAHLAVLSLNRIIMARTRLSQKVLQVVVPSGRQEYGHCTSVGKAILAFLDQSAVRRILEEHGLKRYTKTTITSYAVLFKQFKEIRERGYAVDNGEFIEGVRCMAAPVFDSRGKPVAAIGVSGPAVRVTPKWIKEHAPLLKQLADDCTNLLKRKPAYKRRM